MGVNDYVARDYSIDSYGTGGGTSYSTPLIAGAAALILERYPNWGPSDIINELKKYSSKSNNPDDHYGWGIPDVCKTIIKNERIVKRGEITVFPNPTMKSTNFSYELSFRSLAENKPAELRVFDLSGKSVWNFIVQPRLTGENGYVKWNLRDCYGRKVPTGIYLVYLKTGKEEKIGKFLIIK